MFSDALARHGLQSSMGQAYERELETLPPRSQVRSQASV
jgi:hypothetical protein